MILIALLVNHLLTPGMVRPLTKEVICSTRWGTDSRHVTAAMKRRVFASYGVVETRLYIIDHLIPRELGGADDVSNLWPEKIADAHVKDKQENLLHRQVCAGTVTLREAQRRMAEWPRE